MNKDCIVGTITPAICDNWLNKLKVIKQKLSIVKTLMANL